MSDCEECTLTDSRITESMQVWGFLVCKLFDNKTITNRLRWDSLQEPTMMTVGSHLGDGQTSPFHGMYSRDKPPHCTWSGNLGRHLCCINCSWIRYKLNICAKQKTITAAHVSMCYNCYGHIFWSNIHCFKYSKQFNKKMIFFHFIHLETLL